MCQLFHFSRRTTFDTHEIQERIKIVNTVNSSSKKNISSLIRKLWTVTYKQTDLKILNKELLKSELIKEKTRLKLSVARMYL